MEPFGDDVAIAWRLSGQSQPLHGFFQTRRGKIFATP